MGRAYYAAYLVARDRLAGIGRKCPDEESRHKWLIQRLATAKLPALQDLGDRLKNLKQQRSDADYELDTDTQQRFGALEGDKAAKKAKRWIDELSGIDGAALGSGIRPG